jgi:glucose/arabinose dehydrogenase
MNSSYAVRHSRSIASVIIGVLFLGIIPSPLFAALPAGFETETLATGMVLPTAMAFVPDGRIFIAQKDGTVLVWKNGALLSEPLVRLTDVNSYGDRGLIGIAVDPNFNVNPYVYFSYTYENTPGVNIAGPKTARIVRLTGSGDTADESTKTVLFG